LNVAVPSLLVAEELLTLAQFRELLRWNASVRIASRRWRVAQVQVHCRNMARIEERHLGADSGADVTALESVSRVAEPRHQLHEQLRHRLGVVAGPFRAIREPVSGHRGSDHIERVLGPAAVPDRIGERADDLGELDEGSGPPVRDEQRKRIPLLRAAVDEMNVETVDVRGELLELVQPTLLLAPVEPVTPVGDELLQIPRLTRYTCAVWPAADVAGTVPTKLPQFEPSMMGASKGGWCIRDSNSVISTGYAERYFFDEDRQCKSCEIVGRSLWQSPR